MTAKIIEQSKEAKHPCKMVKGFWINKSDCEITKENPLEGAEKLSAQLNKSEWAKMPGDEMNTDEEKSYYNGYTEDKPDLNQDIFNYIHNLTGSTLLFDEISGLISIFEKHGWDKKVWQKEKPDYPCLFVAKTHTTIPQIYLIKKLRDELVVMRQYDYGNCEYLMSLKDFKAYNYFVIERI